MSDNISQITIFADSVPKTLNIYDSISIDIGDPKWEEVDRAGRSSSFYWNGRGVYTVTIPILLDGWSEQSIVDSDLLFVRSLLVPSDDSFGKKPPIITLSGVSLMKIPNKSIESIEWIATSIDVDSDSIIRSDGGGVYRSLVELTLTEYISVPSVSMKPSKVYSIMVLKTDNYNTLSNRKAIPKSKRDQVRSYFLSNSKTNTLAKLRKQHGKIFKVPII